MRKVALAPNMFRDCWSQAPKRPLTGTAASAARATTKPICSEKITQQCPMPNQPYITRHLVCCCFLAGAAQEKNPLSTLHPIRSK